MKEMHKLTHSPPPPRQHTFRGVVFGGGGRRGRSCNCPLTKAKQARAGTPRPPAGAQPQSEEESGGESVRMGKAGKRKGTPFKVRFDEPLQSGDESDSAALHEAWANNSTRELPLQSCMKVSSSSSNGKGSSVNTADKENVVVTSGEGGKQVHLHLHFN
jgi:hypothetical protein